MCTQGGAQSTAYPTGKSYVIDGLLGSRTHAMASVISPVKRYADTHKTVCKGFFLCTLS
jgi:hypothetical protein